MNTIPAQFPELVAFHGHYCPGLTIGLRASLIALRELEVDRSCDEELVAICETDSCSVDAVQYLTGCTLGKGNLILRNYGKQVFTFGRRSDGKMLRVSLRYGVMDSTASGSAEDERAARVERLQLAPEAELFDVRWVEERLPDSAQIFRTLRCSQCGEGVMEAAARLRNGEVVCQACYGPPYTRD